MEQHTGAAAILDKGVADDRVFDQVIVGAVVSGDQA